METSIKNYQDYVELRNWILNTLSKRKTKSSKNKVIYLVEMAYKGFVKLHLNVSQKKFLEDAAQEIYGEKLTQLHKGLDKIEVQNLNCLLFHTKLNKIYQHYENQNSIQGSDECLINGQKFETDMLMNVG